MRILHLVTRRQRRGAEVFAAQLADGLVQEGHEVLLAGLFAPSPDPLVPLLAPTQDLSGRPESRLSYALISDLIALTRSHAEIRIGLSPRAGLALLTAARSHALIAGRSYCLPEDVQAVFVPVAAHRLTLSGAGTRDRMQRARALLDEVAVR